MNPLLPVYALCRHRIARDGDGVVTLAAVSGCPLRCRYCLNPQGRDATAPSIMYTPETLFDALKIDDLYFQATGGGVTFGGGEPMMHAGFLKEFIPLVKGRWQVRIETSLHVPTEHMDVDADQFIVDIKDLHSDIYASYTGGQVGLVQSNLERLLDFVGPERIIVRVPLIPGYNNDLLRQETVQTLNAMGIRHINTFTYRLPKADTVQS